MAISAVVRPPTARSVSAIADGRRERRMAAHEQQDERVVLRRRPSAVGRRRRPCSSAGVSHDDDRFAPPARELAAQLIGHAPRGDLDQPAARIVGHALARPLQRRRESASCTASSAAAKSPKRRTTAPSTCGASSRSRCSPVVHRVGGRRHASRRRAHHLAHLDRHVQRRAALARRRRRARGDLVGALGVSHVDDPVAGEKLLGLGERAVGHLGRAALAGAHDPRLLRAARAPRRRPARPLRVSSLLNSLHEPDVRLDVLRRPRR